MELAISIIALVVSLIAIFNERTSLHDQAYDKFSQLWFGMDQVFIDYPRMHKYFYKENGVYTDLDENNKDFELGICIAEKFCDVFQYTAPLEKYLKRTDRESYVQYKEMVLSSPIVIKSHDYTSHSQHPLWKHN